MEISDKLSCNNHIQKKCTSASWSLGFIKRNIRTKSLAISEMAYKTLSRTLVQYSSSVWSPDTDKNICKIEMIQRRAARWTLDNYSRQASVTEMLNHIDWRSLEQRRNYSRLCLFCKIVHGLVAIDLPPYVEYPTRISRNSHP